MPRVPTPTARVARLALLAMLAALCGAPRAHAHGAFHEELARLDRLAEASPDDASVFLQRAELRALHGDAQAALADAARARALAPDDPSVDLVLGRVLALSERHREAEAPIEAYLAKAARDAAPRREAWMLLGRCRLARGAALEAADAFGMATRAADPPRPEPFIAQARALAEAGPAHAEDALRAIDAGARALGPLVTLELCAIDVARQARAWDEALARIDGLAARAPGLRPGFALRAEVLEDAGRFEASARAAEAALEALAAPGGRPSRARDRLAAELQSGLARAMAEAVVDAAAPHTEDRQGATSALCPGGSVCRTGR